MKRGTLEHPKMAALASQLDVPRYAAAGILESLWHFAAQYARRGDIGRWSDAEIARAIDWRGDPATLIAALLETGWLDGVPRHRLVVHDWAVHLDNGVRAWLRHHREIPIETKKAQPRLSRGLAHAEQAVGRGLRIGSGGGSGGFAEFYEPYPKKRHRPDAEKAWRQVDGDTQVEAIVAGVARWMSSEQWRGGRIEDPATFLRNRQWEDPVPAGLKLTPARDTGPRRPAVPSSEATRQMLRDKGIG